MRVLNDENGELEFTYEFIEGLCNYSYANYTAEKMGIKRQIIKRAEEVSELLQTGVSLSAVPSINQEEERQMVNVAHQMDKLLEDFLTWDMKGDPKGFLERAKAALED